MLTSWRCMCVEKDPCTNINKKKPIVDNDEIYFIRSTRNHHYLSRNPNGGLYISDGVIDYNNPDFITQGWYDPDGKYVKSADKDQQMDVDNRFMQVGKRPQNGSTINWDRNYLRSQIGYGLEAFSGIDDTENSEDSCLAYHRCLINDKEKIDKGYTNSSNNSKRRYKNNQYYPNAWKNAADDVDVIPYSAHDNKSHVISTAIIQSVNSVKSRDCIDQEWYIQPYYDNCLIISSENDPHMVLDIDDQHQMVTTSPYVPGKKSQYWRYEHGYITNGLTRNVITNFGERGLVMTPSNGFPFQMFELGPDMTITCKLDGTKLTVESAEKGVCPKCKDANDIPSDSEDLAKWSFVSPAEMTDWITNPSKSTPYMVPPPPPTEPMPKITMKPKIITPKPNCKKYNVVTTFKKIELFLPVVKRVKICDDVLQKQGAPLPNVESMCKKLMSDDNNEANASNIDASSSDGDTDSTNCPQNGMLISIA